MQAGQFAADAGGEAQRFQRVELVQGAVRVRVAGAGGGDVHAQRAETRLRPEQRHLALASLKLSSRLASSEVMAGRTIFSLSV